MDGTSVRIDLVEDGRVIWSRASSIDWKQLNGIRAYGVTLLEVADRFFQL